MINPHLVRTVLVTALVFLAPVAPALAQRGADWVEANYTKREVLVPMRDGVGLFTVIYEPREQDEPLPILMKRTPYSVGPYGEDRFPGSLGPEASFGA
ncbi:MAG: CocE/NonD family hydrolase, partial [Planctomycetota bacterium]